MHWTITSAFMFIASVFTYLCVRMAKQQKCTPQFSNLAMFALPTIGYFSLAWIHTQSLILPLWEIGLLALCGVMFSYGGNIASLTSIERAPNPGYSLLISKSYVVFTTIASLFLFHSEITLKSSIAIACIVLFSGFIMLSSPSDKTKHNKNTWLIYAFCAFFAWSGLALFSKYFITIGMLVIPRLFYVSLFATVCILSEMYIKKQKPTEILSHIPLFLSISIGSMLFNYTMQLGYSTSPNPGYVNAVNAASMSALTITSSIFFGDELTFKKLIGVLGVTIGLITLFL